MYFGYFLDTFNLIVLIFLGKSLNTFGILLGYFLTIVPFENPKYTVEKGSRGGGWQKGGWV